MSEKESGITPAEALQRASIPTFEAEFDSVEIRMLSQDKQHFLAIGTKGQEKTLMRDDQILLQGEFAQIDIHYPSPDLKTFFVITENSTVTNDSDGPMSLYHVSAERAKAIARNAQNIRRGNIIENLKSQTKVFVTAYSWGQSAYFVDTEGNDNSPVMGKEHLSFPKVESTDQNYRAIASIKGDYTFVRITDTEGNLKYEIPFANLRSMPTSVSLSSSEESPDKLDIRTTHRDLIQESVYLNGQLESTTSLDEIARTKEAQPPKVEEVGLRTLATRYLVKILSPVFRSEVVTNPQKDCVSEFAKLLEEGYAGVIIVKHFSLRNPVQEVKDIVLKNKVLIRRKLENYIAKHTFNIGVKILGQFLKMHFNGIATDKTRATAAEKGKRVPVRSEGLNEATRKILNTLKHGGILILYPETSRSNQLVQYYLEPYKKRTVGTLLANAKRAGVKIAFLVVDERRANMEQGYWDKGRFYPLDLDLHPFEKFQVYPSEVFTDKQLLEEVDGEFGKVDAVMYQKMKKAQEEAAELQKSA